MAGVFFVDTIKNIFRVQFCFVLFFFLAGGSLAEPHGLWDLSFLTRD